MPDEDILKLLGGYGLGGILAFILGRIMWKVGERMIAAIDRVGVKIDDHTKADLAAQGEVRETLVRLDAKIDEVIAGRERYTPVHGVPVGEWSEDPTPTTGVESPHAIRKQQGPRLVKARGQYSVRKPSNGDDS